MATTIEPERIYRFQAADGWTYFVAQPSNGPSLPGTLSGAVILGTIDGRLIQGHNHLYLREDGHLTNLFGIDLSPAITADDLIDTGITWDELDTRQGRRRWIEIKREFSPSLPLHFGCDHEDGPCQETRE